ncbi:hypothetical protein VTK26DRAFT_6845 [Humicola hyalothermophila]
MDVKQDIWPCILAWSSSLTIAEGELRVLFSLRSAASSSSTRIAVKVGKAETELGVGQRSIRIGDPVGAVPPQCPLLINTCHLAGKPKMVMSQGKSLWSAEKKERKRNEDKTPREKGRKRETKQEERERKKEKGRRMLQRLDMPVGYARLEW